MRKPRIIATIGHSYDYRNTDLLETLIYSGINYFRFNLSKCEDISSLRHHVNLLKEINLRYENDIRIMLDIPFPGRKPRIYMDSDRSVKENDKLIITSNQSKYVNNKSEYIYADVEELGEKVDKIKTIIYADGEGSYEVLEILDKETILVRVNEPHIMYNKKSLSLGYIDKQIKITEEYLNIIKTINAKSIALSFVTNCDEVKELKRYFPDQDIISKIECANGITQVEEISKMSDIMLGRGDLCLYSDYHDLFKNQKGVAKVCRQNGSQFYFATGILSSLHTCNRPTQAEIIDVSNMLLLEPDFLILNYALVKTNINLALKTIDKIYDSVSINKI